MIQVPMYDELSADYDRFVDWDSRLHVELPFVEEQLRLVGARRVLDAACGTGMHAIALAQCGYEAVGADLSAPMIERARSNAAAAGVSARFEVAGFGELARRVGRNFDALLCLGNSLPHVLTDAELCTALADLGACLRPGGLVLVQNRNFDAIVARRERWMEPQSHREGATEWLFLRFYDFRPDGTLDFHIWTLKRVDGGSWAQRVSSTRLRPWQHAQLLAAFKACGLEHVTAFGDLQGHPFDPGSSSNLVWTARRRAHRPESGV